MDKLDTSLFYVFCGFIGKNNYLNMLINKEFTNIYKKLYDTKTKVSFLFKNTNMDIVKYYIKSLKSLKKNNQKTLSLSVIRSNDTELLKLYHQNELLFHKNSLQNIAFENNLESLEYLYDKINFKKNKNICDSASLNGSIECLKFLHLKKCPWSSSTTYKAAKKNHIDCLKFLLENNCPTDNSICHEVVKSNDLEKLKYYHSLGFKLTKDLCYTAVRNKSLECLKYCFENKCILEPVLINVAIECKSHECLQFCYDNGVEWKFSTNYIRTEELYMQFIKYSLKYNKLLNKEICSDLASLGYLKCIKYLLYDDKEYNFHKDQKLHANDMCVNAAKYGRLEVLKFIIENNLYQPEMKTDESITNNAVLQGHLNCLQYLYESKFYIGEKTVMQSILAGRLNCLEYIYKVEKNNIDWKTCYGIAKHAFNKPCLNFLEEKLGYEKSETLINNNDMFNVYSPYSYIYMSP